MAVLQGVHYLIINLQKSTSTLPIHNTTLHNPLTSSTPHPHSHLALREQQSARLLTETPVPRGRVWVGGYRVWWGGVWWRGAAGIWYLGPLSGVVWGGRLWKRGLWGSVLTNRSRGGEVIGERAERRVG